MIPAILAGAGLLGKLFSSGAKGSADQRLGENQQRLQQQQLQNSDALSRAQLTNNDALQRSQMANTDAYNRAGLDMERKKYQQAEPNLQARQALIGSLLSRIQPLQMSGLSARAQQSMPHMNSILDAIGPEARQAGSLLSSKGLSGLQSGGTQFDALPAYNAPAALNLPPATMMALQKSGLLEKIMGGLGLGGSILGGLGALGGGPTSGNGLPIDPMGGG